MISLSNEIYDGLTNHLTPIGNVVSYINLMWNVGAEQNGFHSARFRGNKADLARVACRKSLESYIRECGLSIKFSDGWVVLYPSDVVSGIVECECTGDMPPSSTPEPEPDLTGIGRTRKGRKRTARSQMKSLANFIKESCLRESEGAVTWQMMLDGVTLKTLSGFYVTDRELIYTEERLTGLVDGVRCWWDSTGKCLKKESGPVNTEADNLCVEL